MSDFWESGLFKEEVEGETILKIEVTDRDKISTFSKIFAKLAKALMGAGFGAISGTISNAFLGAIVNLSLSEYKESLTIDKDESIDVIGKAEKKIDVNNIPDNPLELELVAPKTIEREFYAYEKDRPTKIIKDKQTLLKKGQNNGKIKLHINAYDV
ncbi:MAG: hypothetical protein GTO45_16770 [Candidatus Aminicenantes bacterium]|nr:hypothetical protein [Candidatus Aminicenantes bacterium]NIM80395.1 hypothetical protein [Candidatus Aminicenantes bacterium]NIN19782.1 hypothetical protein [Candidatus Aminicenantes bacterium]NIN43664.1 hypothetical protein [Candidatus Aminicenantes bacterium]NIN86409.1 hypothetical protein [Candidatus Aminicenantes bacterium]